MKEQLIKKFTSRKFIVTAISVIVGIITIIFGENETIKTIAGAAMTIVPTIVYCIMEGKIDSASVKTITEATVDAAEKLCDNVTVVDAIKDAGAIAGVIVEAEEIETIPEE